MESDILDPLDLRTLPLAKYLGFESTTIDTCFALAGVLKRNIFASALQPTMSHNLVLCPTPRLGLAATV